MDPAIYRLIALPACVPQSKAPGPIAKGPVTALCVNRLGHRRRFFVSAGICPGQTTRTAAPLTRSARRSRSASSARSIGYGTVETRTPIRAASARNSSPSCRVLAVTLRRVRSSNRCTLVVESRDVAQVDAGDGERPATVQGRQGGRDEGADRREEDGGVQRFGRRGVGVPRAGWHRVPGRAVGLPVSGS